MGSLAQPCCPPTHPTGMPLHAGALQRPSSCHGAAAGASAAASQPGRGHDAARRCYWQPKHTWQVGGLCMCLVVSSWVVHMPVAASLTAAAACWRPLLHLTTHACPTFPLLKSCSALRTPGYAAAPTAKALADKLAGLATAQQSTRDALESALCQQLPARGAEARAVLEQLHGLLAPGGDAAAGSGAAMPVLTQVGGVLLGSCQQRADVPPCAHAAWPCTQLPPFECIRMPCHLPASP